MDGELLHDFMCVELLMRRRADVKSLFTIRRCQIRMCGLKIDGATNCTIAAALFTSPGAGISRINAGTMSEPCILRNLYGTAEYEVVIV